MVSYGKCQHCGMYGMLRGFWYNGEALTPDYLCDRCMLEFDMAMEASLDLRVSCTGMTATPATIRKLNLNCSMNT